MVIMMKPNLQPGMESLKRLSEELQLNWREITSYGSSYNQEKEIWQIIQRGEIDRIDELLSFPATSVSNAFDLRGIHYSKNELRHYQNLGIIIASIAVRYAVDGGLIETVAFTLSDALILRMDSEHNIATIKRLVKAFLSALVRAVHEQNIAEQQMDSTLHSCINYIDIHLYEKLPVAKIARQVNLSPDYLSSWFHRQTGQRLSTYVRKRKLKEAKRLMEQQKMPGNKVAQLLGFSTHSHFITCYKAEYGVTPGLSGKGV